MKSFGEGMDAWMRVVACSLRIIYKEKLALSPVQTTSRRLIQRAEWSNDEHLNEPPKFHHFREIFFRIPNLENKMENPLSFA